MGEKFWKIMQGYDIRNVLVSSFEKFTNTFTELALDTKLTLFSPKNLVVVQAYRVIETFYHSALYVLKEYDKGSVKNLEDAVRKLNLKGAKEKVDAAIKAIATESSEVVSSQDGGKLKTTDGP
jgi:hypothetical protein